MPLAFRDLRANAAALLARALSDIFPKAQLLQSVVTDHGFAVDIALESLKLDKHALELVDERMRLLIQEEVAFKQIEMSRSNAVGYFLHHGQQQKALLVSECPENILSLIDVGGFYDFFSGKETVDSVSELKNFKLIDVKSIEGGSRILGTAFHSRRDLKDFLKKREAYEKHNAQNLSREMQLCLYGSDANDLVCWLPRGVILRKVLMDWWQQACVSQKFQQIQRPIDAFRDVRGVNKVLAYLGEQEGVPVRVAEMNVQRCGLEAYREFGLWRAKEYFEDRLYSLVPQEELVYEITSFLQFIRKTVMIFGLDCQWLVCKGSEAKSKGRKWREENFKLLISTLSDCGFNYTVDTDENHQAEVRAYVLLPDFYGKSWKGPFISINKAPSNLAIAPAALASLSMFGSLERFIAFILEHYRGDLPLTLAPEQVRIIAQNAKGADYAQGILSMLRKEGVRARVDITDQKLGAKIHAAEKDKVPYIAVVGEHERQKNLITLRAKDEKRAERTVAIDVFLEEILREIKINPLPS